MPLEFVKSYPDYHKAIRAGRKEFGHGNYMIEKPKGGAPSREEQLLQDKWNPNRLDQGVSYRAVTSPDQDAEIS